MSSINHLLKGAVRDSHFLGKLSSARDSIGIVGSYFKDKFSGVLGQVVGLASRTVRKDGLGMSFSVGHSSFENSVLGVFLGRARKYVARIATFTIVAFVAGKQALCNWAINSLVCHPMSNTVLHGNGDNSVASTGQSTSPRPASLGATGFVYSTPNRLRGIFTNWHNSLNETTRQIGSEVRKQFAATKMTGVNLGTLLLSHFKARQEYGF